MAHIIAGGGFTTWLYPFLRGGTERAPAELSMQRWAKASPQRVRDQVFHCAQILGLIREYPFHLGQECFNLYHAGVLLFCLCGILADQRGTDNMVLSRGLQVRLDAVGADATTQWLHDGFSCTLSIFGFPDLLCQEGRVQLLTMTADLLLGMRVWAISRNLRQVVLRLRDDQSLLNSSPSST